MGRKVKKRDREMCPWCYKTIALFGVFEMYRHNNWDGKRCPGSYKDLVSRTIYRRIKDLRAV